ncbi:MAG: SDR family NAD(P)-dependent oxidoreductase, partial [Phycisphaerales bacterium]|nr:SDR family NAD(P)-dependent oxidoreductase [Phycisphaerales bacterium]
MSSTTTIAGSVALVTGANRGIGKALVEGLIKAGAKKVYAGARNVETLRPLQIALGDRVVPLRLDVTNAAEVASAAKAARDVTLVFNNAGVAFDSTGLGEKDFDHARSEMEVNYFGVLAMMRAFAPVFERQGGGTFINVASIVSMVNFPSFGTYSASKAAVWSLSIGL